MDKNLVGAVSAITGAIADEVYYNDQIKKLDKEVSDLYNKYNSLESNSCRMVKISKNDDANYLRSKLDISGEYIFASDISGYKSNQKRKIKLRSKLVGSAVTAASLLLLSTLIDNE